MTAWSRSHRFLLFLGNVSVFFCYFVYCFSIFVVFVPFLVMPLLGLCGRSAVVFCWQIWFLLEVQSACEVMVCCVWESLNVFRRSLVKVVACCSSEAGSALGLSPINTFFGVSLLRISDGVSLHPYKIGALVTFVIGDETFSAWVLRVWVCPLLSIYFFFGSLVCVFRHLTTLVSRSVKRCGGKLLKPEYRRRIYHSFLLVMHFRCNGTCPHFRSVFSIVVRLRYREPRCTLFTC